LIELKFQMDNFRYRYHHISRGSYYKLSNYNIEVTVLKTRKGNRIHIMTGIKVNMLSNLMGNCHKFRMEDLILYHLDKQ